MTQKSAPTGIVARSAIQGTKMFPSPLFHAYLTSLAGLAVMSEDRPAAGVKIALRQAERLGDPKPRSPQDND